MDGVLEGATVLCVCKLAFSLPFLASVTASFSPVSFCCCCLLIFTDVLVTLFLISLWLAESYLGDVIALRILLFLSHTYGAVLLLTTPLVAVETGTRLLWPHTDALDKEVTVEEEEAKNEGNDRDQGAGRRLSHATSYFCCLSVWMVVGLSVRWGWEEEEPWAAACIDTTHSLTGCLPGLPGGLVPDALDPCWCIALLLLLTLATGLHRRPVRTREEKHGANNNSNTGWQHLVPAALSAPAKTLNLGGWWVSEPAAQSVDPEKTQSSCTVHSVQMSPCHHGDLVLLSPECLSAGRGGQEQESTKRTTPLACIIEEHADSPYRSLCGWRQWGFPCLGVNIMSGFVGVLAVFVLPLNLGVNVLLIRTIETVLELCVRCLVSLQQIQEEKAQSLII